MVELEEVKKIYKKIDYITQAAKEFSLKINKELEENAKGFYEVTKLYEDARIVIVVAAKLFKEENNILNKLENLKSLSKQKSKELYKQSKSDGEQEVFKNAIQKEQEARKNLLDEQKKIKHSYAVLQKKINKFNEDIHNLKIFIKETFGAKGTDWYNTIIKRKIRIIRDKTRYLTLT